MVIIKNCFFKVVDESSVTEKPETAAAKVFVIKAEWFWTSVQKEVCLDEKEYLYDDVSLIFSITLSKVIKIEFTFI